MIEKYDLISVYNIKFEDIDFTRISTLTQHSKRVSTAKEKAFRTNATTKLNASLGGHISYSSTFCVDHLKTVFFARPADH